MAVHACLVMSRASFAFVLPADYQTQAAETNLNTHRHIQSSQMCLGDVLFNIVWTVWGAGDK